MENVNNEGDSYFEFNTLSLPFQTTIALTATDKQSTLTFTISRILSKLIHFF